MMILGLCVFLLGGMGVNGEGENGSGSGIVFFSTARLEEIKDFYIHRIGCQLWIDQGSCAILKYGNLLVGFCSGGQSSKPDAVITFFFKSREEVDKQYKKFTAIATSPPQENKKYRIYHFYAKDPDGRSIEFQHFTHPIDWDFNKY
jgi:predicted lactoylglutathione lyase